jgi:hypothetical protein
MITGSTVPQLHFRKYYSLLYGDDSAVTSQCIQRESGRGFFMFREGEYAKIICHVLLYVDRLKHELFRQNVDQNQKTSRIFLGNEVCSGTKPFNATVQFNSCTFGD